MSDNDGGDGHADGDGQPDRPQLPDVHDTRELTVEALVELGITEDEAWEAVRDGRVLLALAAKTLAEPERYTADDLAEASGLEAGLIEELLIASGGTPRQGRVYTQADLEAAHLFAQLLEVLPTSALTSGARARGMALAAIVRSDMTLVRDNIILPLREAGADELTVAIALAEHSGEFARVSRRLLVIDYQRRLRQVLSSELSALAATTETPEVEASIGFVDLVGYTALAARVDPTGLDGLLDDFEQRVLSAANMDDDVTVVKFLGDAAMFVASDLTRLCDVLLHLVVEPEHEDTVPLRGGVARGQVLMREGDYFGTAVNTAARLTDIARPWSLLADDSLRHELKESYDLRRIRPVFVRGLGTQRPVAVRSRFAIDAGTASGAPARPAESPADVDATPSESSD